MATRIAPPVLAFYRFPGLSDAARDTLQARMAEPLKDFPIESIETELCYYVELAPGVDPATFNASTSKGKTLRWLLSETFEPSMCVQNVSHFEDASASKIACCVREQVLVDRALKTTTISEKSIIEIGPRLSFTSAFSTNAVSICRACALGNDVVRVERAVRYLVQWHTPIQDSAKVVAESTFAALVHDRMTEMVYTTPLTTFGIPPEPEPTKTIPVCAEGQAALQRASEEKGLAFDAWDLEFYTKLFVEDMGRDPTEVEIFDMAQSNSEHSRHWFFGGKMVIDGEEKPQTLFRMVKDTLVQGTEDDNSIIAFHDNSSVIKGYPVRRLCPTLQNSAGPLVETKQEYMHPLLTAETHNFPSGVAPFPGATTGTGGRIRDVQATGTGAHTVAGTAAYCVGNLNIPGHKLEWEDESFEYPTNLASPLSIIVEASNGASDYGNKFGEPVVTGYARSFGMRLPNNERREWIKPIMFTAGIGMIDGRHVVKDAPSKGMLVVKVGGPCYRIGIGGGAASSRLSTAADSGLDFDAVQRGDAEMENKMNRLIRACIELGDKNPIRSIHDQGAGGNSNVLKEIAEPAGCKLDLRALLIGDPSLSQLEIWGSEYQENCALLLHGPRGGPSEVLFQSIAERENCPFSVLGEVTDDGRVVIVDSKDDSTPVDLDLDKVLGKLPQKTFVDAHEDRSAWLMELKQDGATTAAPTVAKELNNVLKLLQIGSKRFLTNKVDRSVTGLVAQQQCVGPLHTPLADVAVLAHSHFPVTLGTPVTGTATSIGEQPIKGLIDPAAMARMSVGESLTNLMWAKCSSIKHVKMSGNWMWAAKLPGEAASMWDACEALRDVMLGLGVSIDGGKDSLSMAARAPRAKTEQKGNDDEDDVETVKCPGALVMSAYCTCPDVSLTVTPDLKLPDSSESSSGPNKVNGGGDSGVLLFVDLAPGHARMGGSAFAQCRKELGAISPDLNDSSLFVKGWNVIQDLIGASKIYAGHDVSDGGLIVAVLEMAFAGNCGVELNLPTNAVLGLDASVNVSNILFAEELGQVMEVSATNVDFILAQFQAAGVPCHIVGKSVVAQTVTLSQDGASIDLGSTSMTALRDTWESTSFALENLQTNPACVVQEKTGLATRMAPPFHLTYTMAPTKLNVLTSTSKPCVAILRDEGSNGDREMCSAFHAAGFETWDVHVRDLLSGSIRLDATNEKTGGPLFRGLVFVGGFSYADTLDSAKGWAGTILFNDDIWSQFKSFYAREDTFSLGVCNGCQLMALLGWIPEGKTLKSTDKDAERTNPMQPRFVHNESGRFESRFSTVKIMEGTPADNIWFDGMSGSVLGVWVAHGEGRLYYPESTAEEFVAANKLATIRYVDDSGEPTQTYPLNPNGSPGGVASLCSTNGRHLAMMPHPERCFTGWQQPWTPPEWKGETEGPWLQMFQNIRTWCGE